MKQKEASIQFSTMVELLEFTVAVETKKFNINQHQLILIGIFSEKDIELARNGFQAVSLQN